MCPILHCQIIVAGPMMTILAKPLPDNKKPTATIYFSKINSPKISADSAE